VGESIKVVAEPGPGARFAGFEGDCAASSGFTCELTSDGPKDVEATFDPLLTYRVSVSVSGSGRGRVTSTPPGLDCTTDGGICSAPFARNGVVVLKAAPESKSRFVKWQGLLCPPVGCLVTVDGDKQIGAEFAGTQTLDLAPDGGQGALVEINGAQHPLPFKGEFDLGTVLEIQGLPAADDTSLGWTGLPCVEQSPLQRCTFALVRDEAGVLALARLTNWLAGGWTGQMRFNDVLELPDSNLAVLTTFHGDSNFTTPPLPGLLAPDNLLFELAPDGGVQRWSRSEGWGPAKWLSRTPAGLFALGQFPATGTARLNWGKIDGGPPFTTASEFVAIKVNEASWQPESFVLRPDAGFDLFAAADFHPTSVASLVASVGPSPVFGPGTMIVTMNHDLTQVKSRFGYAGGIGILPTESGLYFVTGRFTDGGTGLVDCGGISPSSGQVLLAKVDEQGTCLGMAELPAKGPLGSATNVVMSIRTSSVTYGEASLSDAGTRYFRFVRHNTDLSVSWRTPEVLIPTAVGGEAVGLLVGNLMPWRGGEVLGFFGVRAAQAVDLRFGSNHPFRCPASPRGAVALVLLNESTGAIRWAHCLPTQSPTGVDLLLRAIARQGDSVVLTFTTSNASNASFVLGRLSLPVGPTSPVFLSVTPP
jgi:hypothetical protein